MTASTFNRRHVALTLVASAAAMALPGAVLAQGDKPLRLVLPNATGSGVDTITRTLQPVLAKALGQTIVVDNQPGAGGIVGLQALARSVADGTTLSVVSNNVVIFPSVYKTLPFDMPGDFTPIAVIGYTPIVLVVNPKVAATNAKELAALMKSRNGDMTYASSGNGTILHLAAEMFNEEVGAKGRHIPYKGVGPMVTDLIGGQVDYGTLALPSAQQHIKSGALRAIGVGTAQRVAAAPDIATFVEQGVPNYIVEAWFAFIGPKNLPAAEVRRLHAAIVSSFDDAGVKEAMAKQGNVVNIQSPERSAAFFRTELDKYAKLVKKAGIELQ